MIRLNSIILACYVLAVIFQEGHCESFEKETSVSEKEYAALEKFKGRVLSKIPENSLVSKYAKDDLYMIRWLRTKNLDVNTAERMFLNHLKWRADEKIDTIDQEVDLFEFHRDFPLYIQSKGKKDEPVIEIWFGDWKTRQAVLAGKSKRLIRWIAMNFEMNSRRLYDARAKGKQIAKAYSLIDIEGFNLVQNGCPACLPIYLNIFQMFENHFPDMYEHIYLLNMPPSFDIVMRLIQPVMTRTTRRAFKSYVNKPDWMAELNTIIDKDQRSVRYGGTIQRDDA